MTEISFTQRELDVMTILWRRGSGTVSEVREALGEELAYTTVLWVLQTLALGCLPVVLMPWNPFAWQGHGRLRLAVETDCDRRVLDRGVAARAYGRFLIHAAGRCAAPSSGIVALAGSPSTLETRIRTMTNHNHRRSATRAVVTAIVGTALVVVACDARLPAAVEEAEAVETIRAPSNMSAGEPFAYFVDGVRVTAREAQALAPEHLRQVEIVRPGDGEPAMIRIGTSLRATDNVTITDPDRQREVTLQRIGDGGAAASPAGFDGIVELNGEMVSPSALSALPPEQIKYVEVLRGRAAAVAIDHPAAANGLIRGTIRPDGR